MINQKEIQLLLEAGAKAPSGDNSQPWSFHVENNCITIKMISTRDNPFLNFEQSGTLLACGAVIENIVIESTPSQHSFGNLTFSSVR